ncbi:MAG: tetraacyldisaccharide 4'-kinase [Parvularculaceae bacterium]|nr:tetraacyldisaccharide 4'-kinase [Parvularculaceae bacterium]
MIGEPWFWRERSIAASVMSTTLSPLSAIYDFTQQTRAAFTTPKTVSAPIVCVGNATLGGVGKTPFCIFLAGLLFDRGVRPHFATRGYGGASSGPLEVKNNTAAEVGDEALLLADTAPTWIARNRHAGARDAANGADIVILDDGFQNPTIAKDCSILLIKAGAQDANQKIFPAGPYREPIQRAIGRADIVVQVGGQVGGQESNFEAPDKPVFHAASNFVIDLEPQRVVAFCGVGNPHRFFTMLSENGFDVVGAVSFPDHHAFSAREIDQLQRLAKRRGARLACTRKDIVRFDQTDAEGIGVADLSISVDRPDELARKVLTATKLSL